MSEGRLQLDEFDIEFLNVLCAEEVIRCRFDQERTRVSKQREKAALKLVEAFTNTLDKLNEDDGMESRPELN